MWKISEGIVISNSITGKNVMLKRKFKSLISGKIVNSNNKKVSGAVIKVEKIDFRIYPYRVKFLGYIMSDCNGNYAVLVDNEKYVYYKLSVYQPMIKYK